MSKISFFCNILTLFRITFLLIILLEQFSYSLLQIVYLKIHLIYMSQGLKLINNQYIAKKKVSQGSFGVVYAGQDINSRQYVAIKIEKGGHEESSLDREAQILKQLSGVQQVPRLFYCGKEGESKVMVISFLGRDLTHFLKTFRKFSLKCVLNIAEQMINIIEMIHRNKVIHRDIKPENVLVGRDVEASKLYIVDFGISKFYRDDQENHISFKQNQPFIGTTRYASVAAHKGESIGRRDDLESLAYMLIFLLKGQLPWQNLQFTSEHDKIQQVGNMKMTMETSELCKNIPIEFGRFLDYVRQLSFKSEPNYKFCLSLFKKLQTEYQVNPKEQHFDWDLGNGQQKVEQRKSSMEPAKKSNFKRKNDEVSSGHNSYIDVEQNSLLKTPEQKPMSSLTPDSQRRKLRLASISSYNDSQSEIDNNYSVMLGIQPSMLSRLSKLSFRSNSRLNDLSLVSQTPENQKRQQHDKKMTLQQSPYLKQLVQRSPLKKTSTSQKRDPQEETIKEFSKMNEIEGPSLEVKYNALNKESVHIHAFNMFRKFRKP
ncbi:hypothetical protein pb186bvf_013132 [Paramecium bursaria]